jgi:hypothetical protein
MAWHSQRRSRSRPVFFFAGCGKVFWFRVRQGSHQIGDEAAHSKIRHAGTAQAGSSGSTCHGCPYFFGTWSNGAKQRPSVELETGRVVGGEGSLDHKVLGHCSIAVAIHELQISEAGWRNSSVRTQCSRCEFYEAASEPKVSERISAGYSSGGNRRGATFTASVTSAAETYCGAVTAGSVIQYFNRHHKARTPSFHWIFFPSS